MTPALPCSFEHELVDAEGEDAPAPETDKNEIKASDGDKNGLHVKTDEQVTKVPEAAKTYPTGHVVYNSKVGVFLNIRV
jgi:hypothetical protein